MFDSAKYLSGPQGRVVPLGGCKARPDLLLRTAVCSLNSKAPPPWFTTVKPDLRTILQSGVAVGVCRVQNLVLQGRIIIAVHVCIFGWVCVRGPAFCGIVNCLARRLASRV